MDTDPMPDRVFGNESQDLAYTRASDNAHQQIVKLELPKGLTALNIAVGVNIVVSVFLMLAFFWFMQEKRVDEERRNYDLKDLNDRHAAELKETNDTLAKLAAQVEVLKDRGPQTIIIKREILHR